MKSFLTILLAAGTISVASAQSNNRFEKDQHRNDAPIVTNDRNGRDNNYNNRQRDVQVQQIYREYEKRIAAVKYNPRLRSREKSRYIASLENERSQEINRLYARYDKPKNQYDRRWRS